MEKESNREREISFKRAECAPYLEPEERLCCSSFLHPTLSPPFPLWNILWGPLMHLTIALLTKAYTGWPETTSAVSLSKTTFSIQLPTISGISNSIGPPFAGGASWQFVLSEMLRLIAWQRQWNHMGSPIIEVNRVTLAAQQGRGMGH